MPAPAPCLRLPSGFRFHLSALICALLITALYAAASLHGEFIYDDHLYILERPPVHSLADAAAIFSEPHPGRLPYYRPLTLLTLQIQKTLHGDHPAPFHLFNAILAGLTFLAASALLLRKSLAVAPPLAILGALLFVAHPAFSSCVYPIDSGRETLLPAFFFILGMWAYLGAGTRSYLLALAFLALALLGKEQALALPLCFLAADLCNLAPRPQSWPARLRRYAPMALMVLAYFLMRHHLYHGVEFDLTVLRHPAGPLWSLLFAIQTTFTPFIDLVYEPPLAIWRSWPLLIIGLLAFATLLLIACRWPGRSAGGQMSTRHLAIFWSVWWLATQLPTANIVRQEAPYSDRYIALSLLAVIALLTALISRSLNLDAHTGGRSAATPRNSGSYKWPSAALAALAILAFAITLHRGRFFATESAFYRQWTRTNPNSAIAHNGVGLSYARSGDWPTAVTHYRTALAIKPDYAPAFNNLGRALENQGNIRDAQSAYEQAVALDPSMIQARNNLATILAQQGDYPAALTHLHAALEAVPESAITYSNLGGTLTLMNQLPQATDAYRRAIALDPNLMEAQAGLGGLLLAQGNPAAARPHLERALSLATAAGNTPAATILRARLNLLP